MGAFTQKTKTLDQNSYPYQADRDSAAYALNLLGQKEIALQNEATAPRGLTVVGDVDPSAVQRLVVLIPDQDVDETEIAREIWELASPAKFSVLLLGVCSNSNEEPNVRRRLVTIAGLIREPRIVVDIQLDFGHNLIKSLKAILITGDVVICHAEQYIGMGHKPLNLALTEAGISVIIMTGFYPEIHKSAAALFRESLFWVVSVVIMGLFFWLQIRMLRVSDEWAKNILLGISVPAEIGLLWLWNSQLGN